MSTNWHVYCLDCKDKHRFENANHLDEEMAVLCKHAAAIAALAPLMRESGYAAFELRSFGQIYADWFAAHLGHRLAPIDEYGHVMGQCAERVTCICGTSRRCALEREHAGPCVAVTP